MTFDRFISSVSAPVREPSSVPFEKSATFSQPFQQPQPRPTPSPERNLIVIDPLPDVTKQPPLNLDILTTDVIGQARAELPTPIHPECDVLATVPATA